jgi:hypothetical protein
LPLDQYQAPDSSAPFSSNWCRSCGLCRASLRLQRRLRFHCAGTRK